MALAEDQQNSQKPNALQHRQWRRLAKSRRVLLQDVPQLVYRSIWENIAPTALFLGHEVRCRVFVKAYSFRYFCSSLVWPPFFSVSTLPTIIPTRSR